MGEFKPWERIYFAQKTKSLTEPIDLSCFESQCFSLYSDEDQVEFLEFDLEDLAPYEHQIDEGDNNFDTNAYPIESLRITDGNTDESSEDLLREEQRNLV